MKINFMNKADFFKFQGQTTPHPLAIPISHADGSYIYDTNGKAYLDFVAGVSANSLGHNPLCVKNAINKQLEKYTHVMVYGEFIQEPQLELCKLLPNVLQDEVKLLQGKTPITEILRGQCRFAERKNKTEHFVR